MGHIVVSKNDKFCKDCKFYFVDPDINRPVYYKREPRCKRVIDNDYYVNGDLSKFENFQYCSVVRINTCGPNAKLYEPLNIIIDHVPGGPLMIEGPKKSFAEKVASVFTKGIFK